ncbi:DUF3617 domain-containing protein [Sphingomonas sp. 4RDLI-65]|uniref:DUF3617 domain-containing protein n=1 Tax=Sphingomonas sp. 4RDLI-65 TaxID=3111641 RepID=UPI003C264E91
MIGYNGKTLLAVIAATLPALALAQSSGVQPGLWEIAVTIDTVDMPGAPAFVANMMRGKTTKVKHCITPADAARGPQVLMQTNKSCVFDKYSMVGGKLASDMTCTSSGQVTRMTSTGSFTPTSYTSAGRSVVTGGMPMTMTSRSTGRLIGACK